MIGGARDALTARPAGRRLTRVWVLDRFLARKDGVAEGRASARQGSEPVVAFLKLLIAFAPWLAFLVIAHDTLFRVKLGLVVALVLSIVMGVARLHRGIILWVGLVFFGCATVAVVVMEDTWTLRHMGLLANGALAAGAWLTIVVGKPFTLDYAKEHTDPSLWKHPRFIRSNNVITAVWATTFTLNTGVAFAKMMHAGSSELAYEIVSYALLVGTAVFTVWYPEHLKRSRVSRGR